MTILLIMSTLFILSCNENFHITEASIAPAKNCPSTPPSAFSNKQTFVHTGGDQFFDVSALDDSICWIKIKAWGAGGGGTLNSGANGQGYGGGGGFAETFILKQSLNFNLLIVVGSGGNGNNIAPPANIYGGGGKAGTGINNASSGGGLSGAFDSVSFATALQAESIVIAGAGAGTGWDDTHLGDVFFGTGVTDGPAGGGLTGQDGQDSAWDAGLTTAGKGGSQTAGGLGGTPGAPAATSGTALAGGTGASFHQAGGGGGSGYFGGGGGGAGGGGSNIRETPGGGGSSFISNLDSGDGQLVSGNYRNPANTTDPDYVPGVGQGGAASSPGGNGLVVIEWD